MGQLDRVPVAQPVLRRPGEKFPQQGGVGTLRMFGLALFVAQVLKKIFDEGFQSANLFGRGSGRLGRLGRFAWQRNYL